MAVTGNRMIELRPNETCPACRGTGRDFSIKHHGQFVCEFCEGKGWVPLATCKGCGKPAWKFWPPNEKPILRYCGKEECFTNLVKIHKATSKPVLKGFVPAIVIASEQAFKKVDPMEEYRLAALTGMGGVTDAEKVRKGPKGFCC